MKEEFLTIFTYGGGQVLHAVFRAIAVLFSGTGLMSKLFEILAVLGLMYAGIKAGIRGDNHREYIKWLFTYLVVITAVLTPTGATMHIRDIVKNRTGDHVQNLPHLLVLPAAFINGIGYSATKVYESLFSVPGGSTYLPYHKYGTLFGSQVMSQLSSMKIQDPTFADNMESYISTCMAHDIMLEMKYSKKDLEESDNIFKLLKDHSSELMMFSYREPGKERRQITCKQGVRNFESLFTKEYDLLAKRFPSLASAALQGQGAKDGIIKAMELGNNFFAHKGQSAQDQLRQILIINAFTNPPGSYGAVRALQNQNVGWKTMGEIGQMTLPIMHAIFQALIYSSFPIDNCSFNDLTKMAITYHIF